MKPKILLVEDNPINLVVVKKFVESLYEVDSTTSGKKVEAMLQQRNYQLVLTDINLGDEEISGVEVMQHIRQNYPQLPVVAITGYSMAADIDRFKEQGFTDFVPKPINKEQLLATIAKHI